MAEFFKNITSFVNNQKANFNNAVSSFRSDYFDNLEDQIEALEVKKDNNTISANEESKLNSLIEQRDSLNESVEYKSNVKHRLGIYFFKVKNYDGTSAGSDAIISNVIYFPGNTMGSTDLTKPLQMLADYANQSMLEIDKGLSYINNGSFFPDNSEIQEKQEDFDNNKSYEIVAISENDLDGEIELKQGRDEIANRFQEFASINSTGDTKLTVPKNATSPLKVTNFKK
tara:strand:+ start:16228 stop:16911 length:684 start_codon:yes stop_codon:yes gene_type:complete